MKHDWTWWKHGVIYQIYPRSFYDSNGDGIGDIRGILSRIDYLQDLGIDAIWLSPINKSPMYDFGYDISNYREIDPVFGSIKDFRELVKEAHKRGIRIIMDLVMNHTSHLHPWFLSSRLSRKNEKRDFYIWQDGKHNGPPNNWQSTFGGGAWTWDEMTSQYYLHSFLEEQPDVNWRSPGLKKAMFGEIRYWLDMGVDGFRLDVVNWFIKDKKFRNNPSIPGLPFLQKHLYDRNRPEVNDLLREFRTLLEEYDDRMAVGEVFTFPPGKPELSAQFLGDGTDELNLAFDFSLLYRLWNAKQFYRCIKRWNSAVPEKGWPCYVLSNHDQPRSMSRYNRGNDSANRAYVAAMLHLTLRGTPFIYYGEEIGMKNTILSRENLHDPVGKRFWPFFPGRDASRSPMQWSPDKNAGFSTATPWLPVNIDYTAVNVKNQLRDDYSLLHFYRRCIALRKTNPALSRGDWIPVIKGKKGILAYFRVHGENKVFIVLNFMAKQTRIDVHSRAQWKVLLSTHKSRNAHFTSLSFTVNPHEATLIERIGPLP